MEGIDRAVLGRVVDVMSLSPARLGIIIVCLKQKYTFLLSKTLRYI